MKFREFLSNLGKSNKKQITRFVIGNSSVDYDSFFGSIILAYVLSSTTGHMHQPIIDCPRAQLRLRFEIDATLSKIKLDTDSLYFRESAKEGYPSGVYNLYDHNQREGIEKIQYIVDHHAYSPDKIKAQKYLIDTIGSGLTLLYYLLAPQRLKQITLNESLNTSFPQKYYQFVKGEPFQKLQQINLIDKDINEIIRNGVLMDTFNFDPKQAERWTIFDKKSIDFIEEEQKFEYGNQWIQSLKFDSTLNKKLTLEQALVKDKKIFTYGNITAGYSIIYLSPLDFYHHYQAEMEAQFSLEHQDVDIYFLMSIYKDEAQQFKRQIMYRTKNNCKEHMEKALREAITPLNLIYLGKIGEWDHFSDPSVTISRKKFEPYVRKAFDGLK